ncbi:FecR/PupR family sigma factor regulator [Achromobacter xylosoxidans]
MDPSDARRPSTDPLDAAAYWFARDSGGLMSAAERSEFDAWRRADPAHERAYREMLDTWALTRAVPDHKLRPLLGRRRLSAVSRRAAAGWPGAWARQPAPPPPWAWPRPAGGPRRRCPRSATPRRGASGAASIWRTAPSSP